MAIFNSGHGDIIVVGVTSNSGVIVGMVMVM